MISRSRIGPESGSMSRWKRSSTSSTGSSTLPDRPQVPGLARLLGRARARARLDARRTAENDRPDGPGLAPDRPEGRPVRLPGHLCEGADPPPGLDRRRRGRVPGRPARRRSGRGQRPGLRANLRVRRQDTPILYRPSAIAVLETADKKPENVRYVVADAGEVWGEYPPTSHRASGCSGQRRAG